MKVVYFAWVRERIGKAEEEIDPPPEVATVGELIALAHRAGRGIRPRLRKADGDPRRDRSRAVKHDAKIAGAREIAFFPPMTGG